MSYAPDDHMATADTPRVHQLFFSLFFIFSQNPSCHDAFRGKALGVFDMQP
jgi:hypothetical protein